MPEQTIWDPLRRKEVPLTREERVRQWFISILHDKLDVPKHMMMSEVGMKYGEGARKKDFRADIVVFDRKLSPMMAVECKRPEIELTREVVEQALRYDMVLDVKFLVLTNGKKTIICRKDNGRFTLLDRCPTWKEMLEDTDNTDNRKIR